MLRLRTWRHLLFISVENRAVCQQAKLLTRLFHSAKHGHNVPLLATQSRQHNAISITKELVTKSASQSGEEECDP